MWQPQLEVTRRMSWQVQYKQLVDEREFIRFVTFTSDCCELRSFSRWRPICGSFFWRYFGWKSIRKLLTDWTSKLFFFSLLLLLLHDRIYCDLPFLMRISAQIPMSLFRKKKKRKGIQCLSTFYFAVQTTATFEWNLGLCQFSEFCEYASKSALESSMWANCGSHSIVKSVFSVMNESRM